MIDSAHDEIRKNMSFSREKTNRKKDDDDVFYAKDTSKKKILHTDMRISTSWGLSTIQ